ncbi:MAG: methyltransferase domain-containing protein [Caldisericales bacterium]|nr:methyltransferase domain-containing protein [Caldisericales bacterium]
MTGNLFLDILAWAGIIFACFLFFLLVVLKIVRHYVHFPAPAFVTVFIASRLRNVSQPPNLVASWLGLEKGMKALEIGPGYGTFTVQASKIVGESGEIHALDIQPKVIKNLTAKIEKLGTKNIFLVVGDAYNLPFGDKTFDVVFMVAVLEEIPDRQRALAECKRVLKDGGLLCVGELFPDPDYPLMKTVIKECEKAGFVFEKKFGSWWHYLVRFRK